MRSFVALLLGEAVRAVVAAEVGRLRPLSPAVAWVPGPNLHFTLRFLGHQAPERLEHVSRALAEVAAASAPFSLALAGLGAFPSPARPRILWIGVAEGADEARALQRGVADALATLGFEPEARPWHPHVTIGRVFDERRWRRDAGASLSSILAEGAGRSFGAMPVGTISLMRSELSPAGARYQELAFFPLGPGPGRG